MHSFTVRGQITRYPGVGGWHFVHLPKTISGRIAKITTSKKRAWGYIPVEAKIGKTVWRTGMWPHAKEGVYLLVVKAEVRKKEKIFEGDTVRVTVTLLI